MWLAIPGKILDTREENGSRLGRVQFGGITRLVQLDFVPEAGVGDYVIVHVGFALSKVDAEEAARTYQLLEEIGMLDTEELAADAVTTHVAPVPQARDRQPATLKGGATPPETEGLRSAPLPESDKEG